MSVEPSIARWAQRAAHSAFLVGPLGLQDCRYGLHKDGKIGHEVHLINVGHVQFYPVRVGDVATPANLPKSGQAGPDTAILGDIRQ
jgi:hypothetical protein